MKRRGAEKAQPVLGLPVSSLIDPHERIARRAYDLYEEGGCVTGDDLDHWLEAEREIRIEVERPEIMVPKSETAKPKKIEVPVG